jgi:restriction system protein
VRRHPSLGPRLLRLVVQAKRYTDGNTVGRSEVQSFAGSLDGVGATKGIFFCTSSFSQGAREYVGRISKRIRLDRWRGIGSPHGAA